MTTHPTGDPARDRLLGAALDAPAEAGPDCLDAETLAAWVDGGLTDDARARAEAHAAGCARCQAVLAVVADMDDAGAATSATTATAPGLASPLRRWLVPVAAAAGLTLTFLLLPDRDGILPAPVAELAKSEDDAIRPAEQAAQAVTAAPESPSRATSSRSTPAGTPPPTPPTAPPASPPATPATAEARMARQAPSEERVLMDAVSVPVEIQTPDPAVRYRLTGPTIEKSIDSGATWRAMPAEQAAWLTAGSAPSATTCWLVGREGTVLLSTDGVSWRRVSFPEPVDLTSVTAESATAASVTAADGRVFVTADGGQTWARRGGVQEN